MISLNAIVTRLQTFAESHYFIRKFTYGNPDELDIEKLGSYPALHVVYNGADYDEGTKTYNFELYLIDLPDNKQEDVEQRKEIASDAEQCLEDILADIAAGGNVFYLAEDYEVTSSSVLPIYKANSNVIAGALLDISIQVPHDRSACNLPIDGVEPQGGEFAYARRGLLRMLTINGATDVLSVNTIRVPNGTLIDNGNGDVTLTISGAGGGDVSSVNDVEPDLNGNVALDTDDIPEGATNEYYTDARVDARISAASVTDLSDVTSAGSGAIITDAERTKLAGIEDGAEVNPTALEVKTLYESNTNTNAFTDAEKTKLAGIEDGAEVNAVTSVNGATGAITGLATTTYVDTEVGNEESARIAGDNSLQTQINTATGSISNNAANIATNAADIAALEAADYVNTLNGLSGAVTLSAGSNVTLTQVGNDIEISSSGGGGGGSDSFNTIAVPGQSSIVADHGNDTLNINAGNGIDLTTNATTDTLTIAVDATTTEIPEGTNLYYTDSRVDARVTALGLATTSYVDTEVGNEQSARITADSSLQTQINTAAGAIATNAGNITQNATDIAALEAANFAKSVNSVTPDGTGDVKISTSNIPEGTNEYYTDAKADARIATAVLADISNVPAIGTTGQALVVDSAGTGHVYATIGGGGGGDVVSVNSILPDGLGNVSLDSDDIPEGTTNLYHTNARVDARIAAASVTDLSDVTSAGSGAIITSAERTKLNGIETGAEVNVNADWNASSGDAAILNKPTIPSAVYPTITITGNTTLSSTHEQKFLICDSGGGFTLEIPTGLKPDAEILVYQANTGQITISAGTGVTLRTTSNFYDITAEQYAIIGLKQLGSTNFWVITGERKPV